MGKEHEKKGDPKLTYFVVRNCLNRLPVPDCLAAPDLLAPHVPVTELMEGHGQFVGSWEAYELLGEEAEEEDKGLEWLTGASFSYIAGLLWIHLKRRPDPLVPYDMFDGMVNLVRKLVPVEDDLKAQGDEYVQKMANELSISDLSKIIKCLPITTRKSLYLILEFAAKLIEESGLLTSLGISNVLSPLLLRPRGTAPMSIRHRNGLVFVRLIIKGMIDHFEQLGPVFLSSEEPSNMKSALNRVFPSVVIPVKVVSPNGGGTQNSQTKWSPRVEVPGFPTVDQMNNSSSSGSSNNSGTNPKKRTPVNKAGTPNSGNFKKSPRTPRLTVQTATNENKRHEVMEVATQFLDLAVKANLFGNDGNWMTFMNKNTSNATSSSSSSSSSTDEDHTVMNEGKMYEPSPPPTSPAKKASSTFLQQGGRVSPTKARKPVLISNTMPQFDKEGSDREEYSVPSSSPFRSKSEGQLKQVGTNLSSSNTPSSVENKVLQQRLSKALENHCNNNNNNSSSSNNNNHEKETSESKVDRDSTVSSPTVAGTSSTMSISKDDRDENIDIPELNKLDQLEAKKKSLKRRLKAYDDEFERRNGRRPGRTEKEPIRALYEDYNAIKRSIALLKAENAGSLSNTSSPMSNVSSSKSFGSTVAGAGPIDTLVKEKRALQTKLRDFERRFEIENGRKIKYASDIQGLEHEYRRYKELKESLNGFSEKSPQFMRQKYQT